MKSLLVLATLLLVSSARGADIDAAAGCKNNPAIVAACFPIRGRISAYNGTPSLRIWPIGTRRLLGVVPAENEIIPSKIRGKVTFGQGVFANLVVCPFEPVRPGAMQAVCVESATNIRIRQYQ